MKKIFLIGTILAVLLAFSISAFAGGCGCTGCDLWNNSGASKACSNQCEGIDDFAGCLMDCMDGRTGLDPNYCGPIYA